MFYLVQGVGTVVRLLIGIFLYYVFNNRNYIAVFVKAVLSHSDNLFTDFGFSVLWDNHWYGSLVPHRVVSF